MKISKEYLPEKGVVVITVENPPLATTKHTITASALADGSVVLQDEVDRLTADAENALSVHNAVMGLIDG